MQVGRAPRQGGEPYSRRNFRVGETIQEGENIQCEEICSGGNCTSTVGSIVVKLRRALHYSGRNRWRNKFIRKQTQKFAESKICND